MPYILVRSSLNPGFGGPTFIDYHREDDRRLSDAMPDLRAKCTHGCRQDCYPRHSGPCCSYQTTDPPYKVLNSLETHGYKVVAANSAADASRNYEVQPVWQIWTLHKQA